MKSEFPLKKSMLSLIFSFVFCLSFFLFGMLSAAPLLLLITRGVFTEDPYVVISNLYGNFISSEPISVICICVESILWIISVISTFIFLQKIFKLMFATEKYIRRLYHVLFVIELIFPNALLLLCSLLNFSVTWLIVVLGIIAIVVFIFSIVVLKKIIPDSKVNDFRKHLFEGVKD